MRHIRIGSGVHVPGVTLDGSIGIRYGNRISTDLAQRRTTAMVGCMRPVYVDTRSSRKGGRYVELSDRIKGKKNHYGGLFGAQLVGLTLPKHTKFITA